MRRPTKTCPFCESRVRFIDYKDDRTLGRFITDHGKILPSRLSGVCARHQRQRFGYVGDGAIVLRVFGFSRAGFRPELACAGAHRQLIADQAE